MNRPLAFFLLLSGTVFCRDNVPPSEFTALFNGSDLSGWWGAGEENPREHLTLPPEEFRKKQEKSRGDLRQHWTVMDGELVGDGEGKLLVTDKSYGDFELLVDYKTGPGTDGGICLRGCSRLPIRDFTQGEKSQMRSDKPSGEWNQLRVIMAGSRVWIWLNGRLAVDGAALENHFNSQQPVPPAGPVQLQSHGGETRWRNIFLREIGGDEANRLLRGEDPSGFREVFNGRDFTGWAGSVGNYEVKNGAVVCRAGKGGAIYTVEEFADFVVRLEFKLPPGGNNGLAIRYPGRGNPAYDGMCESQVLDSGHPKYAKLDARQFHGSAYGMVAAHQGYLRPVGEWNYEEVTVRGPTIRVELNGTEILHADLGKVVDFKDGKAHPGKGLARGHFGFAGHNDPVMFRNISIKTLD